MNTPTDQQPMLSPTQYLAHWQGHRSLTRRIIEAFPDDQLFGFSATEPMRPFGAMAWELQLISEMTMRGLTSENWESPDWNRPPDKTILLSAWDALTEEINQQFTSIPLEQYHKNYTLEWGEMTGLTVLLYNIDNEIHHRGQGYVYLRLLGIEPPFFHER